MFLFLIVFIVIRPFICSVAFPGANFTYSALLSVFLISWIVIKGLPVWDNKNIKTAILLFLLALSASLVWSNNKIVAAFEIAQYLNGILLFLICQALSHEHKNKIILTLIITSWLISALAINQYFFGFQNTMDYLAATHTADPAAVNFISQKRVYAPFITPNALGSYLIMLIPLALAMKTRLWLALPLLFALLLTQSIGAVLSFILIAGVYFYLHKKLDNKGFPLLLIVLSTTIVVIVMSRACSQYQIFQPDFSFRMRIDYWRQTLHIIQQHPLTGLGLGNFNLPAARYAHNAYLQIWAENGLLGIASFLFLVLTLFRSGLTTLKNAPDRTLTIGLLCASWVFLIHNLIDFTFFLPEIGLTWCIILGLLFNTSTSASPAKS